MIIGIFSDAHGDVQAIEKTLAALKPAEKLFFLGDVHEFVPQVTDCIDLLRSNNVVAVKGNCDRHGIIGDFDGSYRMWLSCLPREHQQGDLVFVHIPKDPEYSFNREPFRICFCGHTHRSFLITPAEFKRLPVGESINLSKAERFIVGIGSVSRPRVGEKKVAALFDTESGELTLIEV